MMHHKAEFSNSVEFHFLGENSSFWNKIKNMTSNVKKKLQALLKRFRKNSNESKNLVNEEGRNSNEEKSQKVKCKQFLHSGRNLLLVSSSSRLNNQKRHGISGIREKHSQD